MSLVPGGAVPARSSPQHPDALRLRGRAARYLAKLGPAVSGQHGNNHTYRAACILINDFCLPSDVALDVLREWNQTCRPPWHDSELTAFIGHACKYARGEPGTKLRPTKQDPEALFDHLLWVMKEGAPEYVHLYYLEELAKSLPWFGARCGQKPSPRSIPREYRSRALRAAIGTFFLLHQRPPRRTRLEWLMGQAAYEFADPGRCAAPLWVRFSPEKIAEDAREFGLSHRTGSPEDEVAAAPWTSSNPSPEEASIRGQTAAILEKVYADLSNLERMVVDTWPSGNLRGDLARSNDALAIANGSTPGTIKQARHRIREKAREYTEPQPQRRKWPWSADAIPELIRDGSASATCPTIRNWGTP